MSHTATINDVIISDENALRATITELKSKGIKCELLENSMARAYSAGQAGMDRPARFVIQLNDSPYDVGLYERAEGTGYEARTDLYQNHVRNILGSTRQEGESTQQAALGKLFQTYAVNAATLKATQQGMQVNRVTKQDGTVQLRIVA